jgi:hypothetical protein
MQDSQTFWITLSNIALAVVVVVCFLTVVIGAVHDVIAKLRKRRSDFVELDRDMEQFFGSRRARK